MDDISVGIIIGTLVTNLIWYMLTQNKPKKLKDMLKKL